MLAPMASAPLVPTTAAPAFMLQQQQKGIKVSGTVVDDENSPLIGVSVTVKGSKDAAITDIDGHFYISVPSKNSVLVFNYLGFKQQEVRVGSDINFNIQLKEDAVATDEVVVVGYGNQKKLSVIGSIQTLDPGKLQVGSSRSLSNNLAGQLAGVIAYQPSLVCRHSELHQMRSYTCSATGSKAIDSARVDRIIHAITAHRGINAPLAQLDRATTF